MTNSFQTAGTQQLLVSTSPENMVEITISSAPAVVEIATAGPQGPPGPRGFTAVTHLSQMEDVDVVGRVANSVLYYDTTSGTWKGDDLNTVISLTDGGAF